MSRLAARRRIAATLPCQASPVGGGSRAGGPAAAQDQAPVASADVVGVGNEVVAVVRRMMVRLVAAAVAVVGCPVLLSDSGLRPDSWATAQPPAPHARSADAAAVDPPDPLLPIPAQSGVVVSAAPDHHYVSPNAKFTVTGRISNEGAAFKDAAHALLEQRFGGEWVPVGKPVKAAADGTYALPAVSEDLQAQTSYRVVVPRGGATLATSREFTIELAAGRHTAFKLLGGARWQPCAGTQVREIKYGINLASIPPGYAGADEAAKRAAMIADVAGAVEQLALATGLKFTRVEHEQPIPQQPGSGAAALQPFLGGAELVIGFADNSASATSTLLPAKVGRSSGWGSYVDTNGDGFIDQGYVVLDARHRLDGGYKSSRNGTWQQIIMHEVAHASGLSHPDDAKQLMHPQINPALTTWGAGDLNGLQRIGLRPKQDSPKRIAGLRGDACA